MTQFTVTAQDNETSNDLAKNEESTISDRDWVVIMYLRQHYLKLCQPRQTRLLHRDPDKKFFVHDKNKYLRLLFACEPIAQGSRLTNLHIPVKPIDHSSGTSD